MSKSNIVLIGMPGSGKSTIGKRLAMSMGMAFLDSDSVIEAQANMSLQDLINFRGVTKFRRFEEQVLSALDCENTVIATGGSAVYSQKAMHALSENGVIVYLSISLATMLHRIQNQSTRGLVKLARLSLQELYQERRMLYSQHADTTLANDWLATDLVVERMSQRLKAAL